MERDLVLRVERSPSGRGRAGRESERGIRFKQEVCGQELSGIRRKKWECSVEEYGIAVCDATAQNRVCSI